MGPNSAYSTENENTGSSDYISTAEAYCLNTSFGVIDNDQKHFLDLDFGLVVSNGTYVMNESGNEAGEISATIMRSEMVDCERCT